ncbi:MAG: tripartite tricarboxylate transporter TctB family protein [Spirochaetia bacterium]|nr:tripartite tricarboxylate transporter TctB family protein [Spirochaetia bacterium]MCF7946816.1 tripartite tricarboxylate transporter TctB family protein [Spirochaetia bacterium]MCF7953610.1 tripartite tricarboxylate transporter TctB family protein [Spirochaetales bacterium]
MKRLNSRVIFPIITGIVGVLWIIIGLTNHDWWVEGRPQSGFFPSIVGGLLLFISFLAVINELKEEKTVFLLSHIYPVLAAVGMVVLAQLVGFFPALILYVFGWLKWFEKYRLVFSTLTALITGAAMYGIFYMWLRVPFPEGLILKLI